MSPIRTVNEVFDAIQQAKAGALEFGTNFFPVQRKLQDWIDHEELHGEFRDSASFFFRKDRDFRHLYFCSSSVSALQREIATLPALKTERVVLDLVGKEPGLSEQLPVWEAAGFRRYTRLFRMARASQPVAQAASAADTHVVFAVSADAPAILKLLEAGFDRYGEQLPTPYEIEVATESRQILVAKLDDAVAGLLFFETQGFTSTLRFWTVTEQFREMRFGSALMWQYFATQNAVRRFILWVAADNENAVQKYRHYGYAPDGLVDHVLANELIPS